MKRIAGFMELEKQLRFLETDILKKYKRDEKLLKEQIKINEKHKKTNNKKVR